MAANPPKGPDNPQEHEDVHGANKPGVGSKVYPKKDPISPSPVSPNPVPPKTDYKAVAEEIVLTPNAQKARALALWLFSDSSSPFLRLTKRYIKEALRKKEVPPGGKPGAGQLAPNMVKKWQSYFFPEVHDNDQKKFSNSPERANFEKENFQSLFTQDFFDTVTQELVKGLILCLTEDFTIETQKETNTKDEVEKLKKIRTMDALEPFFETIKTQLYFRAEKTTETAETNFKKQIQQVNDLKKQNILSIGLAGYPRYPSSGQEWIHAVEPLKEKLGVRSKHTSKPMTKP